MMFQSLERRLGWYRKDVKVPNARHVTFGKNASKERVLRCEMDSVVLVLEEAVEGEPLFRGVVPIDLGLNVRASLINQVLNRFESG